MMADATYADQVYDHILSQLVNGDLRPGDFLDRKQIAQDLEVSLIPVSDAVQKLTYEGFLSTRRRKGTLVRTPSIEDVRGQLLLREALECQCARLYCGDKINQSKKQLLDLAEASDAAAEARNNICTEDFKFHEMLVELSECDALIDCFQRVVNLSMFHQVALITPFKETEHDRHVDLLNDLCDASPEQADVRIRKHMRIGKEGILTDA